MDRHLRRWLEIFGRERVLTVLYEDMLADPQRFIDSITRFIGSAPIDLAKWPNLKAYHSRMRKRPSIARAWDEEVAMYAAEQERTKAA